MDDLQIYGELRELIANPTVTEVSNRQLRSYLIPALEWLSEELKYDIRTDEHFGLVAGQQEYPLPQQMGWMIWVEYAGNRLDPATTYKWDREGIIWRTAPSATPREYAIQGRNLILLPPPDAASITSTPELKMRYVAVSSGLAAAGTPYLSDLDQWLAVYEAAVLYCYAHPSEENMARIDGYKDQIARRLPMAKRRSEAPIEDYFPHFHVQTSRIHGAR